MSEDRTQQLPNDALRQILARFDSVDARFDSMDARLDSMDSRLTTLEEKVDRRLQETRPIWEQVLIRLTAVEEGLASVREGQARVEARLEKVEDEVDGLGRKVSIFNKDILKIQDRQNDLKERLDRIDSEHAR
jgi:chromosome segregation ATPase